MMCCLSVNKLLIVKTFQLYRHALLLYYATDIFSKFTSLLENAAEIHKKNISVLPDVRTSYIRRSSSNTVKYLEPFHG